MIKSHQRKGQKIFFFVLMQSQALLVSFPLAFHGEFYLYGRACLELACKASKMVFVCLRFASEKVAFSDLQSLLIHVYGTIAEQAGSECRVFVVDPSIGQDGVLAENSPWRRVLVDAAACVEWPQSRGLAWPRVPDNYKAAFPFYRSSVRVEPRFEHGVNGGDV
jgi:hypothetical protein